MKRLIIIKTIILLEVVLLTVLLGIGKINVYNSYNNSEAKSLSEYFWENAANEMNYLVKEYNRSVKIDNYTITLDSAAFNDITKTIYARFRVSQKDSTVKSYIYSEDNMWKAFGEDNRFSLMVNSDRRTIEEFHGKYDGKDLIIYCKIQYFCDETEDTHEIYLSDKRSEKTTYENCAAKFLLEPTSNTVEIQCSTALNICISPFSVKLSSVVDLYPRTIKIIYKNGETQEILNIRENPARQDDILSITSSQGKIQNIEIIEAPNLIDIEQIESVIYNDVEYKR